MTDAITTLMADDPAPAPNGDNPPAPAPASSPDPAPSPAPAPEPKKDDPPPAPKPADPAPKEEPRPPADWRQEVTGGNEEFLKTIQRYGSIQGVVKALHDTKTLIAQGKFQRAMPDATDEKAMKEWRKDQGIPEKPEDYKFTDDLTKAFTDDDKPVLSNFTEYAVKEGLPNEAVNKVAKWYVQNQAVAVERQTEADNGHREEAEDALRLDWQGEYKGNMNLAKRFLADSPLGAEGWAGLRDKDGRMVGSRSDFLKWASDQGRERFGDSVFANPDSEKSHNTEKEEIQKILNTDRPRYFREGWDKKLAALLDREEKRAAKK